MKVKDKIIIVTGGSGLIGREIVSHLKSNGATVINVDVNEDAQTVKCDISNTKDVVELLTQVMKKYGRIDGLVNSAYPRTADWGNKFEDIRFDSWKQNVDLQMNSVFFICQQVLKIMQQQKSGSIVNIASIYGVVGNDFSVYEDTNLTSPAAYSAIKGGIINFTRYLASYFGKDGIRVNCVSPGGVFDNQNPNFVRNYENKVPLKRMAQAFEIAPSVTFLLSDDATYITGHNLVVDGGWTAI